MDSPQIDDARGSASILPALRALHRDPQPVAGVRSAVAGARAHGARGRSHRRVGAGAAGRRAAARGRAARRAHAGAVHGGAGRRATTRCCSTATSTSSRRWRAGTRASGRGRRCCATASSTAAAAPTTATPPSPASPRCRRCSAQRAPHARCVVLIEACEESGSYDLPAYIEALADRIGTPSLVICLDSGCGNYDQLWITTSLRGLVGGTLTVATLDEGVHSGAASGIVPSSFRILRQLLGAARGRADRRDPAAGPLRRDPRRAPRAGHGRGGRCSAPAVAASFPFAGTTRPVVRRRRRAAPQPHLAPAARDHRRRRPAAARERRQRAAPAHDAEAVAAPAADARRARGDRRARSRCSPPIRPTARRCASRPSRAPPAGTRRRSPAGWRSRWRAPRATASAATACFQGEGGTIPFMAMLGERFPQRAVPHHRRARAALERARARTSSCTWPPARG